MVVEAGVDGGLVEFPVDGVGDGIWYWCRRYLKLGSCGVVEYEGLCCRVSFVREDGGIEFRDCGEDGAVAFRVRQFGEW